MHVIYQDSHDAPVAELKQACDCAQGRT